ncbi:MAG: hypothetical protein ACM4AI_17425 [Acidobacteriota bacterium]
MKPVIRAFLVAPLAAPALYWIIAFISAVADPNRRGQALGSPFSGVAFIFVFGALISYAVMLVAGVPTYLLLRRAGILGLASLIVAGVCIGVASAFALAPYLRGELFSIPLSPLHGVALGAAVAAVFWALVRGNTSPPSST